MTNVIIEERWQPRLRGAKLLLVTAAAVVSGIAAVPAHADGAADKAALTAELGRPIAEAQPDAVADAVRGFILKLPPTELDRSIDLVDVVAADLRDPAAIAAVADAASSAVDTVAEAYPVEVEDWWARIIKDSIATAIADQTPAAADPVAGTEPEGLAAQAEPEPAVPVDAPPSDADLQISSQRIRTDAPAPDAAAEPSEPTAASTPEPAETVVAAPEPEPPDAAPAEPADPITETAELPAAAPAPDPNAAIVAAMSAVVPARKPTPPAIEPIFEPAPVSTVEEVSLDPLPIPPVSGQTTWTEPQPVAGGQTGQQVAALTPPADPAAAVPVGDTLADRQLASAVQLLERRNLPVTTETLNAAVAALASDCSLLDREAIEIAARYGRCAVEAQAVATRGGPAAEVVAVSPNAQLPGADAVTPVRPDGLANVPAPAGTSQERFDALVRGLASGQIRGTAPRAPAAEVSNLAEPSPVPEPEPEQERSANPLADRVDELFDRLTRNLSGRR